MSYVQRANTIANHLSNASTASTAHDHTQSPRAATYSSLAIAGIGMASNAMIKAKGGSPGVLLGRTLMYGAASMLPALLESRKK